MVWKNQALTVLPSGLLRLPVGGQRPPLLLPAPAESHAATSGNPTGQLALYRVGASIAVNAQAQQIFPNLPVASAHERALALAVAPASLP